MTPEQRLRIEENRRRAAELRAKKGYKDKEALEVKSKQATLDMFFKKKTHNDELIKDNGLIQNLNQDLEIKGKKDDDLGLNKDIKNFTKVNTESLNKENLKTDFEKQNFNLGPNSTPSNISTTDDNSRETFITTRGGRRAKQVNYIVSSGDEIEDDSEAFQLDESFDRLQEEEEEKALLVLANQVESKAYQKEKLNKKVKIMDTELDTKLDNKLETFNNKLGNKLQNNNNNGFDRLKQFQSPSKPKRTEFLTKSNQSQSNVIGKKSNEEERFPWLANVLDANQNPPDHPDYDPNTLYIPPGAWAKLTPFERQFWEVKSQHFDTVVFFKKGKFYELYEDDALIGHQQFDLKLTDRVNMKMVGVPESSFEFWASKFVAKGYKIAKVEQMESAVGKTLRERESKTKADKVIRRELTCILTQGTLTDPSMLPSDMSSFCMAIREISESSNQLKFGIAIVDAAIAEFHVGAFIDDSDATKLETLLLQSRPKEIVYEKGELSLNVIQLIRRHLPDALKNALKPGMDLWDPITAKQILEGEEYLGVANQWSKSINEAINDPTGLSALGGLTGYLRNLKLDKRLLSLGNIKPLGPILEGGWLGLDGQTLHNLEVLEAQNGGDQGTLHALLNRCTTPFGKRLFKRWVSHPLRSKVEIEERLNAVEFLMSRQDIMEMWQRLSKIKDLERLLTRIHAGLISVAELLNVVKSFKELQLLIEELKPIIAQSDSILLKKVVMEFPKLTDKLSYFETGFDHQVALKEGQIIPFPGVDSEYDQIQDQLKQIEEEFHSYKEQQSKILKVPIQFKDILKEKYQLELNANVKVPSDWIKTSQTKAVRRYRTPHTTQLLTKLEETEEIRSMILKKIQTTIHQKFDQYYTFWLKSIQNISTLDCLISLAKASFMLGEPRTRPIIEEVIANQTNILELEEARHPTIINSLLPTFIPNDIQLGINEAEKAHPTMILLTGPNMGGKTTLLRQICLIIIMAQMGCFVPAKKCRLTPFDRIFTRIGANDDILSGQSTFMVELNETSKILKEATKHSLVILDELGRGTSTFDGYSIAYAVLHHLLHKTQCLGLFSTHYHLLTQEFQFNFNIGLKCMSYLTDSDSKQLTFLYKLIDGVSEKSFGMNVASLAGLPEEVINLATTKAEQFELEHTMQLNADGLPLNLLADVANLIQLNTSRNLNENKDVDLKGLLSGWKHYLNL